MNSLPDGPPLSTDHEAALGAPMKTYGVAHILVPTDFSPISRAGLHHAERLAKLVRAEITLVNVIEPMEGSVGTSGMLRRSVELEKKAQKVNRRRLERIARTVEKRSGVPVRALVTVGRVARVLREFTAKGRADLIVMGTHGASGFVENLLGSNTYRVTSLTDVPLLGVHRKMAPSGYRHIVYPVRDQTRAWDKFPHAVFFAKLFRAPVRIVGLLRPEEKAHERAMRAQCAAIARKFAKQRIRAGTEFTAATFFPDAIIRYAHARPASLVVVVQSADFHLVELFQGTFTKRVLHSILSPVLVVPQSRVSPRNTSHSPKGNRP
jgi:nucleotide-binding universal stress UspA family protein